MICVVSSLLSKYCYIGLKTRVNQTGGGGGGGGESFVILSAVTLSVEFCKEPESVMCQSLYLKHFITSTSRSLNGCIILTSPCIKF